MNVLITGAAGGLGRAMAAVCAARGYDLVLTDIDETALRRIATGLERRFDRPVRWYACDLTDAAATAEMFETLRAQGTRLGMALGIAGVDFEGGFLDRPGEQLIRIVQVNVEATLRVVHAATRLRDPAQRFTVVIASSLAGMYPMPLKATYAASKRFLLDFAIALRQETRHAHMNVLALCPGGLPTTKEAMAGIAAQGIWGGLTTNGLEKVASRAIDKALAGKARYTPGTLNRVLFALGRLVPPGVIAKMLHGRWRAAQKKWLDGGTQVPADARQESAKACGI